MVAPAAHDESLVDAALAPGSPVAVGKVPVSRAQAALQTSTVLPAGALYRPASSKGIDFMAGETEWNDSMGEGDMVLELADGLALSGHSFGAEKSVSGECVFQTGKLTSYLSQPPTHAPANLNQVWLATPSP